jgi:hypothetical protein
LHSCRYSGDTNTMPLCVYISQRGTHKKHNLLDPKSHTTACTALTDSNPLAAANSLRSILTHTHTHSILHSPNVHWIKGNMSLPQSWHVCQLLPACGTIQHQSNYVFWQANNQSEKVNQCSMVLFGQIHHLTHNLQAAL